MIQGILPKILKQVKDFTKRQSGNRTAYGLTQMIM